MKRLATEPKGISIFKDLEHLADTQDYATLNEQDKQLLSVPEQVAEVVDCEPHSYLRLTPDAVKGNA